MVHQKLECRLLYCIRTCCVQQMTDMKGIVCWSHRCHSLHCCCCYRWFAHCCRLCQFAHCCWSHRLHCLHCPHYLQKRCLCLQLLLFAIVAVCTIWLIMLTYRVESGKNQPQPGRHISRRTAHKATACQKIKSHAQASLDTQSISVEQPVCMQPQWLGLCLKTYILSQAFLNNDHAALLTANSQQTNSLLHVTSSECFLACGIYRDCIQ